MLHRQDSIDRLAARKLERHMQQFKAKQPQSVNVRKEMEEVTLQDPLLADELL